MRVVDLDIVFRFLAKSCRSLKIASGSCRELLAHAQLRLDFMNLFLLIAETLPHLTLLQGGGLSKKLNPLELFLIIFAVLALDTLLELKELRRLL